MLVHMVSTADPLSIDASDLWIRRVGEPTRRPRWPPAARPGQLTALRARVRPGAARRHASDRPSPISARVGDLPSMEPGGPREYIYFDPPRTRAAIVTCGGLCPGLNNVIRGLVLELADNYGVTEVLGFRDGFRGMVDGTEPLRAQPRRGRGHPQPGRHHPRHLARQPGSGRDGGDPGAPRHLPAVRDRRGRHAARRAARSPTRRTGAACRCRSSACRRRSTTTSPTSTRASASRPRSPGPPSRSSRR